MRKILSISIIFLILLSGVTLNVALHYCGGSLANRNLSLSGKPASCGMEDVHDCHSGIKSLCCENSMSSYTFNNIYLPSSVLKISMENHALPVCEVLTDFITEHTALSFSPERLSGPPGTYSHASVELDLICIFRI